VGRVSRERCGGETAFGSTVRRFDAGILLRLASVEGSTAAWMVGVLPVGGFERFVYIPTFLHWAARYWVMITTAGLSSKRYAMSL